MTTIEPRPPQKPEDEENNPTAAPPISPPSRKGGNPVGCIVAVALLLGLFLVLRLIDSSPDTVDIQAQDAEIRARAAAENPYASFRAVINDCLMCGTSNPYGGWETEDGRTLVLNESGSFIALYEDGTSARGDWTLDDGELCLLSASGGRTCFRHEQKIDAMTLDDALYIRQ